MVHSGRYADALQESKFIDEHLPSLPEGWIYALHQWEQNIKARDVQPFNSRLVFEKIRGIPNVFLPTPEPAVFVADSGGW